jgi:uncharacterized protein (TIGR00251 family)
MSGAGLGMQMMAGEESDRDDAVMQRSEITVRVQPRARKNEVIGERDGVLIVRVSAPPVDGRANEALCRLVAKHAGVGVRAVSVTRGVGAREKVLRVEGIGAEKLRRALGLEPRPHE